METKLYHYHLTPVTLNPTFLTISALSYNACPSILSFSLYLLACVAVQLLSRIWLLATHGLQHARLCYPSPSPGACSNSCPSSPWCHPAILSSVVPSPCLQSFPASGNFWVSWLFVTGGQSIGASGSVLPMNIQDWFPLDWLVWSPCSARDPQESSPTP